jgi:putative ABC transport system permease protein
MRLPEAVVTSGSKAITPWHFVGTWPGALDLNQHVVEHGRIFNDVDEEMARNVCVIGTDIRDALFGDPDEIGREVNPVGEFININNQRFRIIGMFRHYESELDRKTREQAALRGQAPEAAGPSRRGVAGGAKRSRSGISSL